jgi:hypothetical protein
LSLEIDNVAEAEPVISVEGQYVRHRYARCRRSAGVEGHITSERNASEPERSHAWPPAAKPSGPHREGEEPKPMMHGRERSDPVIVAMKSPNKTGGPAAEVMERRAGAEENASQHGTRRTQSRESVSQTPERVRTAARLCRHYPRWEPDAGKPLVRFCAGCALKAHETMSPEMATAVKLSRQPRTESCVVSGNGRCEA